MERLQPRKVGIEKAKKDQRHLDNISLADKTFWRGQWFEGGTAKPRRKLQIGGITEISFKRN